MGMISEAAQSGDQLATLVAIRDYLANRLDGDEYPLSGRDVAPTANALKDVLDAIEDIKTADGDPDTEQIVADLGAALDGMENVISIGK